MVRLKSIQAVAFKNLFEVLKDILSDINIFFDHTGIRITAFDVARVTLIDVFMPAGNFEEYSCPHPVTAGVNIGNMFKFIKSTRVNDVIMMSVTNEIMTIHILNDSKKARSIFNIKLMDLNEDELEVPDTEMKYMTTISSVDFQKLIRDMLNIGSDVHIRRSGNSIQFKCSGDFAEQETTFDQVDIVDEDSTGTFKLKYLSMFTKGTVLCAIIQILQNPGSGFIVFQYSIANLGEIKFYLAPNSV